MCDSSGSLFSVNWIEELGIRFQFIWNGDVGQFPSSELKVLTSSLYLNWTGRYFQLRWRELVNISSSYERKLFEQFKFFELKWNYHIPSLTHILFSMFFKKRKKPMNTTTIINYQKPGSSILKAICVPLKEHRVYVIYDCKWQSYSILELLN